MPTNKVLLETVNDNLELCVYLLKQIRLSFEEFSDDDIRRNLSDVHAKIDLLADLHFMETYGVER